VRARYLVAALTLLDILSALAVSLWVVGCQITVADAPPREPAPRTAAAAAIADAWVARVTRKPNDHRRLREHREAKRRAER
jgi:hypothetical protein